MLHQHGMSLLLMNIYGFVRFLYKKSVGACCLEQARELVGSDIVLSSIINRIESELANYGKKSF
jgi:hypothetical protein